MLSFLVVWVRRIEDRIEETAVGKLGGSSAYKVVVIVREGTIEHSLISEYWTSQYK